MPCESALRVVAVSAVVLAPDFVPAPDDAPAAEPELLREEGEVLGGACVFCGEQRFQVGTNKLATTIIRSS